MGMISQRCLHVHIRKSNSHCRNLLSGVPQSSVFAPALFNQYTCDISTAASRKYMRADDFTMMASGECFTVVELALSDDLDKLRSNFHNWWLKLNTTKAVCRAFHLTNRLTDYELNITTKGERIPFDKIPKYLGVILDCIPSYHEHMHRSKSKQTLQPTEETCQQPLGSRIHNFTYFYICFMLFCIRILLSNMDSKPYLQKPRHIFK